MVYKFLKNMSHRGATGADPETGDGAGIMIQIPHVFFDEELGMKGITLPQEGSYGVGMVFLPMEPNARYYCEGIFERILKEEGQELIGWRDVPVNDKACGVSAQGTRPVVQQVFIKNNESNHLAFERKLYIVRKRVEQEIVEAGKAYTDAFYVCSLSSKTIIYKGQFLAYQIENFFPELQDERMVSALATVHQRYSTNTFPSWS